MSVLPAVSLSAVPLLVGALAASGASGVAAPPEDPPADWRVADGYRVEIVHAVDAATQGSWVSLATGPSTDAELVFFAGDQYGALHEVRLPRDGGAPSVERVPVDLGHAQGLVWFDDELFVVVNGMPNSGLYALDDGDGDGTLDRARRVLALDGEGEHGPHAVVAAPDGEHLLVVCGNHTKPPGGADLAASRVPPAGWTEGLLAPREWDPNGHARNVMAPGGFVIEVDPTDGRATLVASGLRNSYDLAVLPTGEVFTFDSDMEWDLGSPWYRPTRLVQVVSGGEHGWRSGSGKWPVWREDMLPPVAEVGPGSPTGVTTGEGAAFPADDQRALYLLDWTFGTVHRARLVPDGAGFTAELEPFLTGRALPLTDAVVADDGALYLTTGGRRTRSHLVRVRYEGEASTAPATWPEPNAAARRRVELERSHAPANNAADDEARDVPDAPDTTALLAALADPDRRIRYAARVGLEHLEVARYRDRIAALASPHAAALAWLAALRAELGDPDDDARLVDAALTDLLRRDPSAFDEATLLAWLRAHQWASIERPTTRARWRDRLVERLDPLYPHASAAANAELAVLLVHLDAPRVIERTLDLVEAAPVVAPEHLLEHAERNPAYGDTIAALVADPPPTEGLRFAFALRGVADGWTPAARERWFRWLQRARASSGGVSFGGFLDIAERQALATCDPLTRLAVQPWLTRPAIGAPPVGRAPLGPGRAWTVDDAEIALTGRITGADLERGRELFAFACASCHRVANSGGSVGPDLSSAARTYSLRDLLVAVIEPDASVSDQYGLHEWRFVDGSVRLARHLGEAPDGLLEYLENLADPSAIGRVAPADLVSVEPSPHSPMPPHLVDLMNAGELRDLVAFVASAGGTRLDLAAWQGEVPRPVAPPVLSAVALRIVGGAVVVVLLLVGALVVLGHRTEGVHTRTTR